MTLTARGGGQNVPLLNSVILTPIDIKFGMSHNLKMLNSKIVFNFDFIMTSLMLPVQKCLHFFWLKCV